MLTPVQQADWDKEIAIVTQSPERLLEYPYQPGEWGDTALAVDAELKALRTELDVYRDPGNWAWSMVNFTWVWRGERPGIAETKEARARRDNEGAQTILGALQSAQGVTTGPPVIPTALRQQVEAQATANQELLNEQASYAGIVAALRKQVETLTQNVRDEQKLFDGNALALGRSMDKLTLERDNARMDARGWKRRVDEAADVVGKLEVRVEALKYTLRVAREALVKYASIDRWKDESVAHQVVGIIDAGLGAAGEGAK